LVDAFLLDAVRTPYGLRGGALSSWHPVDLAAEVLNNLLDRAAAGGDAVDDVILGCTSQVGAQACNVARRAVLAAGWPEGVPAATIDSHAASSTQAVHRAAQAVMSGAQSLVVAGGVEVMTAVPLGAALAQPAVGKPYGRRLGERYRAGEGLLPPGLAAEEVARRWSIGRAELDSWTVSSYEKALRAQAIRMSYVVPIALSRSAGVPGSSTLRTSRPGGDQSAALFRDEGLEQLRSAADVAALPPAYRDGGLTTAANMAVEGDGASAVLVVSAERARVLGLAPRARFVAFASTGEAPAIWPAATIPATRKALERADLGFDDVDLWYVFESSAAAVLAWLSSTAVDPARVNPEGGALASVAPLGAVGAGLFAAAVSGLVEGGKRRAVVTVAGEGGIGTACVIESA
jgi:acetyl-CoA acetyltransferase family protein